MSAHRTELRSEDGFSLVELMVTLSILLIVLFATLTAFDSFNSSNSTNSRLTSAEDNARSQVDQITAQLRNATPVGTQVAAVTSPAADSAVNDIIFGTYKTATGSIGNLGTSTGSVPAFARYCVDTTSKSLWVEVSPDTSTTSPGTACPSTGSTWSHAQLLKGLVGNTGSTPLFTVNSGGRAVGVNLQVDAGRTGSARLIGLRSAAYLRSASGRSPNLSVNDITVTCSTQNGKKVALLALGAGVGGGDPLSASYTVAGVPVGTGSVKVAADSPLSVAVTVTNLLGLKQILTRTVTC